MITNIDPHDENLIIYLEESNEYLSDIENDLLSIEAMGENIDDELINKVFRAAHTIKGGAGFFNLINIKKLGHKAENILDLIRSKHIIPNSEIINILLITFDRLRELLNNIESSNEEDISEMMGALTTLLKSEIKDESDKEKIESTVDIKDSTGRVIMKISAFDYGQSVKVGLYIYLIKIDLIHDLQFKGKNPLVLFREMLGTGCLEETVIDFSYVGTLEDDDIKQIPMFILFSTWIKPAKIQSLFEVDKEKITIINDPSTGQNNESIDLDNKGEPNNNNSITQEYYEEVNEEKTIIDTSSNNDSDENEFIIDYPSEDKNITQVENTPTTLTTVVQKEVSTKNKGQSVNSIRVKVELLEQLMILAGELVLSRNELNEAITSMDTKKLNSSGQRISQVTSEIQEAIMMTRLQNIGSVFNKFPRIVRDMSQKMNKDINLKIFGNEVELDKTIIEGLNDPLLHMIRNSIDHGIESPEEREKQGKSREGTIILKAYHEAGQVIIEISDDGKGLDIDKLTKKAITTGIITSEDAAGMSFKNKMNLIFNPGFSTAEVVTDVSGRGVGMDVVKNKLDELGGIIDINSTFGKGSTFRIKLPLTLAIIPSLLVTCGEERFAIPQINVDELINIPAEDISKKIEKIGWVDVLDLRGDLVPLVMLTEALGIPKKFEDTETGEILPDRRKSLSDERTKEDTVALDRRGNNDNDLNVVIVSSGIYKYGLIVEALDDNLEIVVKPLGMHIHKCKEYAGATIMGDGKVALIVDVAGIAIVKNIESIKINQISEVEEFKENESIENEVQSYLVFRSSREENCALPMQLVTRVEHITASQLEYIGNKRVMQYRGKSLPVVALQDVADCIEIDEDLDLSVIVTDIYDREIGLLAVRPVDSIEVDLKIDKETLKQKGVLGSAIIEDKTTLIIDIFEIVETVIKDLAVHHKIDDVEENAPLVLLAEDSSFFRNQINSFIAESGYRTIEAEDGKDAWDKLIDSEEIPSLIVTDIEMPKMDGYTLSKKIRSDNRYKDIPIIAVTSMAGENDVKKGEEAGITEYHVKLDKESLLKSLKKLIPKIVVNN